MNDAVKVTAEVSLAWFKTNPDAGAAYMAKFFEQHPATEWVATVRQERTGFFDLVATRKTQGGTKLSVADEKGNWTDAPTGIPPRTFETPAAELLNVRYCGSLPVVVTDARNPKVNEPVKGGGNQTAEVRQTADGVWIVTRVVD